MKPLQFWQDKWQESLRDFQEHRAYWVSYRGQYKWRFSELPKLKKQYGHALNRDYWGGKVYNRRKRWLRDRLVYLTQAAMHRKEMLRLARTKLPFFEKKIVTLGGTVNKHWAWDYKRDLTCEA